MSNELLLPTAQEIVESFEKSGLKPIYGSFYRESGNGEICGCALSALYAEKCGIDGLTHYFKKIGDGSFYKYIKQALNINITDHDLDQFYRGFDLLMNYDYYENPYFTLGVETRNLLEVRFGKLVRGW